MSKKIVAVMLAAIMCLSMMPTWASAAEGDGSPYYFFQVGEQWKALTYASYTNGAYMVTSGDGVRYISDAGGDDELNSEYTEDLVVLNVTDEGVFNPQTDTLDTVLTSEIESVTVTSGDESVFSYSVGAGDENGVPVTERYHNSARKTGSFTTTTKVTFDEDTGFAEITLTRTNRVVQIGTVYVEAGSGLAQQLSTGEGFSDFLYGYRDLSGLDKTFYLVLPENFTITGTVNVYGSVQILANGATLYGNLVINGQVDDFESEPYPANVVVENMNFVCPKVETCAAVSGGGGTIGLRGCRVSGYLKGLDTGDKTYTVDEKTYNGDLSVGMIAGCTFEDNDTALDITTSLMMREFYGNTFEDNHLAIRLSGNAGMMLQFARFYNCTFENNSNNVHNETNSTFYMPRCVYINGGGKVVKPAPGKFNYRDNKNVVYTPYYFEDYPELHDVDAAYTFQGQTVTDSDNRSFAMNLATASDNLNAGALASLLDEGVVEINVMEEKMGPGGANLEKKYSWSVASPVSRASSGNGATGDEAETEEELNLSEGVSFDPLVEIEADGDVTRVNVGNVDFGDDVTAMLYVPYAGNSAALHDGEKSDVATADDGMSAVTISGSGEYLLVPASEGEAEAKYTAPTCTEAGYWTYTYGGRTYTETAEPAKGHDFGVNRPYCSVCREPNPDYVPTYNPPSVRPSEPDDDEPVSETPDFTDVPADAYYADAVSWAIANGITTGTGEDTFSPNAPCTRAQVVTFLWRAMGSPEPSGYSSFSDVSAGSYYSKAVRWALEKGITSGTSATTFSPNAVCTRAEVVTFLMRALDGRSCGSAGFADVASGSYYADAVSWAVANGVTDGTSATTFSPDTQCNRAQIVTFLYRAAA